MCLGNTSPKAGIVCKCARNEMFITGKIEKYVGTGILSKFFNLRFFEKKMF
jgi:hypothetical protein